MHDALPWLALLAALAVLGWLLLSVPPPGGSAAPGAVLPSAAPLSAAGDTGGDTGGVAWWRYALVAASLAATLMFLAATIYLRRRDNRAKNTSPRQSTKPINNGEATIVGDATSVIADIAKAVTGGNTPEKDAATVVGEEVSPNQPIAGAAKGSAVQAAVTGSNATNTTDYAIEIAAVRAELWVKPMAGNREDFSDRISGAVTEIDKTAKTIRGIWPVKKGEIDLVGTLHLAALNHLLDWKTTDDKTSEGFTNAQREALSEFVTERSNRKAAKRAARDFEFGRLEIIDAAAWAERKLRKGGSIEEADAMKQKVTNARAAVKVWVAAQNDTGDTRKTLESATTF
jgi:hypothetical protein